MTDKEIQEQLEALRIVGERLRAEGREACRLFLREAGIIDDEGATPPPAAPEPERGEGGNKKWDSIRLIGEPKKRFDELTAKDWEWHSFYHGWLEGRNKMLREVLKDAAEFDSRYNDMELEIKAYRKVLADIAAERCVSYIVARAILAKYLGPPSPQPATSGEEKEQALKELLQSDPTVTELVEKALALGVVPVITYADDPPPPLSGNDVEGEVPEPPADMEKWIDDYCEDNWGSWAEMDIRDVGKAAMAGMYRKMQEENFRHENARNRAQDRCLELRKELRTASAKSECADVEIKHLSALNRGLYDQIAYLQTALAGQKGKAEEAEIEVLVVKNGSWEMQKYLTDQLSAANTRIESLKELSEGWERQYHQAEGRIESLTEELAIVRQFRDNVAGERDEYPE